MNIPDSKDYEASMGPAWGGQDPGGPHVGPMNLIIWDALKETVELPVQCSTQSFLSTRPSDKWLMRFTRPNGRYTRPKFQ